MYERMIRETLAATGHAGQYDPKHIEAWMRLECGTLDWITKERFNKEVAIARQCTDAFIASDGIDAMNQLARSL